LAAIAPNAQAVGNLLRDLMARYGKAHACVLQRLAATVSPPVYSYISKPNPGGNKHSRLRDHPAPHAHRWWEPVFPWIPDIAQLGGAPANRRHHRLGSLAPALCRTGRIRAVSHNDSTARGDARHAPLQRFSANQGDFATKLEVAGMIPKEVTEASSDRVKNMRGRTATREATRRNGLNTPGAQAPVEELLSWRRSLENWDGELVVGATPSFGRMHYVRRMLSYEQEVPSRA
jgi:hypothetical protein